jgi:hypothetical protein
VERVENPASALAWLAGRPAEEAMTGYDADGWEASTWILHAMYENRSLVGLGTHDEVHKRRLDAGDIAPLIIGEVNLDEGTTVTGTSLGYVIRPGQPWHRIRWDEYLFRFPDFPDDRAYPPCDRWFPHSSWPVAIEPPPEGSLDEEGLDALLTTVAGHTTDGMTTECYAFYAALPAGGDFDAVHLWRGPLSSVPALIDGRGGSYPSSPTNIWASDQSWFVLTDWDLQGTKVSGSRELIDAVRFNSSLETTDWQRQIA